MKINTFCKALSIFFRYAYRIAILMRKARRARWIQQQDQYIKEAHREIKILSKHMLDLFEVQVHIHGAVPQTGEPLIIMSNHISWLDMFVWGYAFDGVPVTAVSKRENFWIPFFGYVIKLLFVVPVKRNRKDPEGDRKSMKQVAEICRQYKLNLLIAPEGTRTPDGKLGRFKRGGMQLAKEAGLDILPMYIQGLYKVNSKKDGLLKIRPGVVHVYFGEVIPHNAAETVEGLRDTVRTAVEDLEPPMSVSI